MTMYEAIGRWFSAFVIFMVCWVGMSQLGVYLLGPKDNGIILFGVTGMFLGIGLTYSVLEPYLYTEKKEDEDDD